MKKQLLFAAMFAFACTSANAQWNQKSFFGVKFYDEVYEETWSVQGFFNHVSANGMYAVGCDDSGESTNTGGAFMWKLSAPDELEQLSTTLDRITACDVSNDGTIVGGFEKRDPENPETKVVQYPGYKPLGGEWVALPVPDEYSTSFAKSRDFSEEARAITPDGSYIAGNFHYKTGEKDLSKFGLGVTDITVQPVTIWKKEGSEYVLQACYTDLGKAGSSMVYDNGELKTVEHEVNYNNFLVHDISNDGQTVVGMNVAGSGGFNPAFVRDGKLVQLFDCGEEGDPEEEINFNGGHIMNIDANGNMYGYYQDNNNNTKYFVYTADGKLEYYDDFYICATKDGEKFSAYDVLTTLYDCSEDGNVVVGAGVGASELSQYNYPILAYKDNATTGVDRLAVIASNVSAKIMKGGMLYVNGEYTKATVYNAAGTLVGAIGQGQALNMGGNAAGTYIVKVDTPAGVKTFKVLR